MEPAVSIVLLVGRRRERAARALASILAQDGIDRCEVLLVDAGPGGMALPAGADHSSVTVVPRQHRPLGGQMRAEAMRLARAPVVVFLEEHAQALPGWLIGIEAVFSDPTVAGATGEVHNLNPGVGISDAVHVMSFSRWMPPLDHGWDSDVIMAHNTAYRRADVLELDDDLDTLLESEIVLQRALRRRGGRLVIDPRIRVGHTNEGTYATITRGYYLWNVSFGRTWSRIERWSALRRAAQVVGFPWWVCRRVTDMFRNVPPAHRRVLMRHLPGVLLAQTGGAIGIAVGCLDLDRGAARRFTDYELDIDRPGAASHVAGHPTSSSKSASSSAARTRHEPEPSA